MAGIRIREVEFATEDFRYRTPIKFGGVALDRVTLLNVHCTVETSSGKTAKGFGSMPLSNVWAFPSRVLDYATTLQAMLNVADTVAKRYRECTLVDHPIDITHVLEPEYHKTAAELSWTLTEPIPPLWVLSRIQPTMMQSNIPLSNSRRRRWQSLFGLAA